MVKSEDAIMMNAEIRKKIEAEYELYEGKDLYRLEDSLYFIITKRVEINDMIVKLKKELYKNRFQQIISTILGKQCQDFGYFTPDKYDIVLGLIHLQFAMTVSYYSSMGILADIVNDNNVTSVNRLASFTIDECGQNIGRMEEIRANALRINSYTTLGVYLDDIEARYWAFNHFFNGEVKVECAKGRKVYYLS